MTPIVSFVLLRTLATMATAKSFSRAKGSSNLHPSFIYTSVTLGGLTFLGILFWSLYTTIVPTGHRGVVIRLGKVQPKILNEGFYLKRPLVSRIQAINAQVQRNDVEVAVGTKDLQQLTADISLNWHLDPAAVNETYQEIGSQAAVVKRIIQPAIHEVVKAATPKPGFLTRGDYCS